jgi:hypothetical protein
MSQKIFGIGLPKSGTLSLRDALQILGYNSVHCPTDDTTVNQIRNGEYELELMRVYDAASDIPIPAIFPQLHSAFPGSKFILTYRDENSWIESQRKATFNYDTPKPGSTRDFYRAILYGITAFNENRFRWVHHKHHEDVARYFSGENAKDLLTINFTAGEGWDELCAFLNVPVPSTPFPHSNESHSNQSGKA